MESIEGYSYYDTPAGPQYVRNGSAEINFEDRRRNNCIKFHPYSIARRPDRAKISLSSDREVDMPILQSAAEDVASEVHTFPFPGQLLDPDEMDFLWCPQQSSQGVARNRPNDSADYGAIDTIRAQFHPAITPSGSVLVDRTVSLPPKNVDTCNQANSLGLSTYSDSRPASASTSSHALYNDLTTPHVEQYASALYSQSPTSMKDTASVQITSSRLDKAITYKSSCRPHRKTSPHDGAESQNRSRPLQGTALCRTSLYAPLNSYSRAATTPDSVDITSLETDLGHCSTKPPVIPEHVSAGPQESMRFENLIDETLFEYGPFYETNSDVGIVDSQQYQCAMEAFQSPQPPLTNRPSTSIDDFDRPLPQVGLVGGYFAPEDEATQHVPPEVDSRGNIRIARLPMKKAAIAYDLPAVTDMTVTQLKSELKKHSLPAVGKKIALQARLELHLKQTA